jgi:hypothetical protein
MRDRASGYPESIYLEYKSDLPEAFKAKVLQLRAEFGPDHAHQIIRELHIDFAGEQNDLSVKFNAICQELKIVTSYGDPTRKTTMAHAEVEVGISERTTKKIMMQGSLLISEWKMASMDNKFLRQHTAIKRKINSRDGDAVRPAEQLSNSRISRRECNHRLRNFVQFGTVCYVSIPKQLGSNLEHVARSRLGISWGRTSANLPRWKDPMSDTIFRSRDFIRSNQPPTMSWQQFCGVTVKESTPVSMPRSADMDIPDEEISHLHEIGRVADRSPSAATGSTIIYGSKIPLYDGVNDAHIASESEPTVTPPLSPPPTGGAPAPKTGGATGDLTTIQTESNISRLQDLIDKPQSFINDKVFKRFCEPGAHDHGVCEGIVHDCDDNGEGGNLWGIHWDDGNTGDFDMSEMRKYCVLYDDGQEVTQIIDHKNDMQAIRQRLNDDEVPYTLSKRKCDTWSKICAMMKIPTAQKQLYYTWLSSQHGYGHIQPTQSDMPWFRFKNPMLTRKLGQPPEHFAHDTPWPPPCGGEWERAVQDDKELRAAKTKDNTNRIQHIMMTTNVNSLQVQSRMQNLHDELDQYERMSKSQPHITNSITDRFTKADLDRFSKMTPPIDYEEAMRREDAAIWEAAVKIELSSFDKHGVMSHDHTEKELRDKGITASPVPLKFIFSVKTNEDGYDKHKARLVLQGHKGYMTPGIHYADTFTPSPDISTCRFVQALCILLGWIRLSFDISTAYLQSDDSECGQIPLIYPKGFRKKHSSGARLVGLLLRNLYGHPSAARAWGISLSKWIKFFFNKNEWTASNCDSDPCLFVLTSPNNYTSLLTVYTDDCDLIGENATDLQFIKKSFDDKYGVKECDPEIMLGVRRTVTTTKSGVRELQLTQPDYIDQMCAQFADHLPSRSYETPFEPGTVFGTKEQGYDPSSEEQNHFKKMGYLNAAGMLLWCARQCYPEIAFAVSQICSVMSKPSEAAWHAAMRVIAWLRNNKSRGIKYSSNGNDRPIFLYDSGHNQYTQDRRGHHGYTCNFAGGPICYESKKHDDLGDSTPYNEYMALYHATRRAVWISQLISEMGKKFEMYIDRPILMLGDNDAATTAAREKRITPTNRHIALKYHYSREQCMNGIIRTERVASMNNTSDLHSKAVTTPIFKKLMPGLKGYADFYQPRL